jgi:hypothetical protein
MIFDENDEVRFQFSVKLSLYFNCLDRKEKYAIKISVSQQ